MIARYYLRLEHEREWTIATKEEYIAAEVKAGFQSRNGKGHVATSHFVGVQTKIHGCIMYHERSVYDDYPIDIPVPAPVKEKKPPKPVGKKEPVPVIPSEPEPPRPCVNHNWTHYGEQKEFECNRKKPILLYIFRRCMSCERLDELEKVTVFGKEILKKWVQVKL